jgi:hypothetical protein
MFERYTELARRTLFFARYEVSQHASGSIEPRHLLLGLVRVGWPIQDLLSLAGLSVEELRRAIESTLPEVRGSTSVELPIADATKRVLQRAALEAGDAGHIGPEHLLVALIAEEPEAASWLIERGFTLERTRDELRRLGPDPSSARGDPQGGHVRREPKIRKHSDVSREAAPGRPDVPPSYTVHITPTTQPSGRVSRRGPGFWSLCGVRLSEALADLYDIDESRIDLGSAQTDGRIDIVAVLPVVESEQVLRALMAEAIERHFEVALSLTPKELDVYVVTANGALTGDLGGSGGIGAISVPFGEPRSATLEATMRQMSGLLRAGAKVRSGASPECCVRRVHDLPAAMLADVEQQMQVRVSVERRTVLVLEGRSTG